MLDDIRQQLQAALDHAVAKRDALNDEVAKIERALEVLDQPSLPGLVEGSGGGGEPARSPAAKAAPSTGTTCGDCGQVCSTPNGLAVHRARKHGHRGPTSRKPTTERPGASGGPVSLICPECHEAHPTPGSLRVHRRKEHGISEGAAA